MNLFERVIEQRLLSYLEDIDFINRYQSGFRQNKSTDNHLFRLSQSVMESFNWGEHVVAAFLDVLSVPWVLAEFYFNIGLQRLYTGTCIINGFLCLLIVFLKSKTHQLNLKDVIKLNRNLR